MNCSEWEERIALYAGGDLGPEDAAAVEQHLGNCAGCQVLASGLKLGLEALRDAHAQDLSAAHYAAVRTRVLAKLRRRGRWSWAWGYGLATAALVLAVMAVQMGKAPRKTVVSSGTQRVEVAEVVEKPRDTVRRPGKRAGRRSAAKAHVGRAAKGNHLPDTAGKNAAATTVVVKLLTDDPNVVIYWIADGKGE